MPTYATKADLKNATGGKLETIQVDLSKLGNVAKNDVIKKTEYHVKFKNIKDEISDITNLATKTTLNNKINEVKGKKPNITNLANTNVLTAVENKITNIINLVKKTDYNTKINKTEKKVTDYDHNSSIDIEGIRTVFIFL